MARGKQYIPPPPGAKRLLAYFHNRSAPDSAQCEKAHYVCKRWIAMCESGEVNQWEINELLILLDSEEDTGSGWLDLRMQFGAWVAKQRKRGRYE